MKYLLAEHRKKVPAFSRVFKPKFILSGKYAKIYYKIFKKISKSNAQDLITLATRLFLRYDNKKIVLLPIARGGIPVALGIKILSQKLYKIDIPLAPVASLPYVGIDRNHVAWLADKYKGKVLVFIDGWNSTGRTQRSVYYAMRKINTSRKKKIIYVFCVLYDLLESVSIFGRREDILCYWAISQAEQLGFSPYRLDPIKKGYICKKVHTRLSKKFYRIWKQSILSSLGSS